MYCLPRQFTVARMTAKLFLLVVVCCASCFGIARAATSAGDRGNDVNITYPATLLMQNGGPVIDMKHPPLNTMHAAVGDGMTDDTAAFQDVYDLLKARYDVAGCFTSDDSFYVYIPNGIYRVSDTIIYRGAPAKWKNAFDICHVKFIGQSRAGTILRLADHARSFQDAAHPRPVISFQHSETKFNNGPGNNELRNLTIDVGNGNPGAVGLMFQGANQTDMRNLTIRSSDGAGQYGIWFRMGSVQGYYADIFIQGFDYGIYDSVNPEGDPAFEYLTLSGQRLAGINISGGGMSLRSVLSDQSAQGGMALKIEGSGAHVVLVDSTLNGGGLSQPAVELAKSDQECLFARNVSTAGYSAAVRRGGVLAAPGKSIAEYVSSPVKTLIDAQKTTSLNLPVQDTPQTPWYDPAKDWAVVDDYHSVQEAMNSGKPVVCFKQRKYKLPGNISVPSSVKFVNLMASDVDGGAMVISQPSPDPVLFQDGAVAVRVEAQRDVVERCVARNVSNPKALPVTFYLENVNDVVSGPLFCQRGSKVFARQIDVEYVNVPQIVCNGGVLWIFGFKTEDKGAASPFIVKNGGSLEVLGGYVNMLNGLAKPGQGQNPIITNDDSNASVSCFTNMAGLFVMAVRETRQGTTYSAANTDFPSRGGGYRTNYVIPLYVGCKVN